MEELPIWHFWHMSLSDEWRVSISSICTSASQAVFRRLYCVNEV